jgi:putative heme iron utilization protein
MIKSICCQAETRVGYYNMTSRPDIHGHFVLGITDVVAVVGTYCTKCGKLCDYTNTEEGINYFTNGDVKWNSLSLY